MVFPCPDERPFADLACLRPTPLRILVAEFARTQAFAPPPNSCESGYILKRIVLGAILVEAVFEIRPQLTFPTQVRARMNSSLISRHWLFPVILTAVILFTTATAADAAHRRRLFRKVRPLQQRSHATYYDRYRYDPEPLLELLLPKIRRWTSRKLFQLSGSANGGCRAARERHLPNALVETGTAVVGLPGEVFVELGLAIKKASPYRQTLVMELANGDESGYIPTGLAYQGGGYEVINSVFQSGGGEAIVETAVQLLRETRTRATSRGEPRQAETEEVPD